MEQRDDAAAGNRNKQDVKNVPPEIFPPASDLLQAVLDNVPAGVAIVDSSGEVVHANETYFKIIGAPVAGPPPEP